MSTKKQKQAVTDCRRRRYDQVTILMPKGERERIKAYADAHGMSMNVFVLSVIRQAMGCDSQTDLEL